MGKIFDFTVFDFIENTLTVGISTRHAPVPHSKRQPDFFKNLFPPTVKGGEENYICFIKIQSEKMKITWDIRLFTFYMDCNFSKYDGFTVL